MNKAQIIHLEEFMFQLCLPVSTGTTTDLDNQFWRNKFKGEFDLILKAIDNLGTESTSTKKPNSVCQFCSTSGMEYEDD